MLRFLISHNKILEMGDMSAGEHVRPSDPGVGDMSAGEHVRPSDPGVGDMSAGEHVRPSDPGDGGYVSWRTCTS